MTGGSGVVAALAAAFRRFGTAETPGRFKAQLATGRGAFGSILDDLTALWSSRLVHLDAT